MLSKIILALLIVMAVIVFFYGWLIIKSIGIIRGEQRLIFEGYIGGSLFALIAEKDDNDHLTFTVIYI